MHSKFYVILTCAFLFLVNVKAQDKKLDSIALNINHYVLKNAESSLFVHFDKNVYTNNDQVWFTGYLLKTITNLDQYHTLYLSLINNKDSSIVLQDKFLIDKGFAFGALTLPDSIPGGAYRFVANTNIKKNDKPDGEFIQPITIKSTTVNPLTASISIFKTYDEQTKNGTALLKILSSDNRFVENAEIKYQIGRDKQFLLAGTAKSSVIGELMINFPAGKITPDNNLLSVTVKKGKDIRYIKFDLPFRNSSTYQIQFYPEGGYLVDNLLSKVGFEIKDGQGAMIKAKAVLYENDLAIDTIQTNSIGIGSFSIRPQSSKKYFVKLLTDDQFVIKYNLPTILKSGTVLTAGSAIANDDFRIHLESNANTKVHILVRNFSNILLHTTLTLEANKIQNVRFKLDSVPIGLHTVTVLDSNYRPIAERIFFAHYDQLNQAELTVNKNEFSTRDQVNLKLTVFDKDKTRLPALVSIACVQSNRVSANNNQNIVDYFYLGQYLNGLPHNPMGLKYLDHDYLNDVLLVKTWSRYKWPETEIVGKNETLSSFEYKGNITRKKKSLMVPMGLTTIAGENLKFLNTDSAGQFNVPFSNLIIKQAKLPVWLSMATAKYDQYDLKINEPLDELKKYLVQQNFEQINTRADVLKESSQSISSLAGIRLKEVVITKTKDERTDFAKNSFANRCGDYVCRYNILNCPNHGADFGNTSPIRGKTYANGRGGTTVYQGCTEQEPKPNITILKGINLPKEFYVSDISNKNEPINFATVYWNYQVLVDGETPISFNTGDLTGQFKIIVQGVSDGGVVYREKEITVKNK
jgi:NAD-dependent dihydropyrimidine dehydrogenase PreA subunit